MINSPYANQIIQLNLLLLSLLNRIVWKLRKLAGLDKTACAGLDKTASARLGWKNLTRRPPPGQGVLLPFRNKSSKQNKIHLSISDAKTGLILLLYTSPLDNGYSRGLVSSIV